MCVCARRTFIIEKKKTGWERACDDGFFFIKTPKMRVYQFNRLIFFNTLPLNTYSWAWTCFSEIILIDSAFRRFTSSSFFYYNYINFIFFAPNQFIIYLKSRRKKNREEWKQNTQSWIWRIGDRSMCQGMRQHIRWMWFLQGQYLFTKVMLMLFSFVFHHHFFVFVLLLLHALPQISVFFFAVACFPSRCVHVNIFLFAMKSTTFTLTLGLTLGSQCYSFFVCTTSLSLARSLAFLHHFPLHI